MSWVAVAKKEYVENVRNAWVITVTIAFLALTVLTSMAADLTGDFGGGRQSFANLVNTLSAMQSFSGFLLPILALVLTFATIAGERESGSLALLTAQPISRGEIVAGKWLGLWGVLATAIVLGFGGGGLIVLSNTQAAGLGYAALFTFLGATLAWGAAWISIAMFISALFDRRGTAIAGSIAAWFLFGRFVWNMLTLLVVLAALGPRFDAMMASGDMQLPGWLILTQLLNPNTVHDGLLITSIEGYPSIIGMIARQALPDLYTPFVFMVAMLLWIVLPYVGAHALFHKKDV